MENLSHTSHCGNVGFEGAPLLSHTHGNESTGAAVGTYLMI